MAPSDLGAQLPSTGRDFPDLRVEGGVMPGARWRLSTRFGGRSEAEFAQANMADHVGDYPHAVAANRRSLAASLSGIRDVAFVKAEHGARVQWVSSGDEVTVGDALITDTPGLGLAAMGADCAVLGLSAQRKNGTVVVAVVHCGWRGLVTDVVGATLQEVRDSGAVSVAAVLGPAICGDCYQVSVDRWEQVQASCSASVASCALVRNQEGGNQLWGIDIGAGVLASLAEHGVSVRAEFGCTYEQDQWFSLRRAVDHWGPQARTGRHALMVASL